MHHHKRRGGWRFKPVPESRRVPLKSSVGWCATANPYHTEKDITAAAGWRTWDKCCAVQPSREKAEPLEMVEPMEHQGEHAAAC